MPAETGAVSRTSCVVLALCLAAVLPWPTAGQTPPAAGSGSPAKDSARNWTIAAGLESFKLRGVGSTTPRAHASPVSWVGKGPGLSVRHDRATPARLHRFVATYAAAGRFEDDVVVTSLPRPAEDSEWRVGVTYEYRRYPFRDLWLDGFDLGIGAQGLAGHFSATRHTDPGIAAGRRETDLAASFVAVARYHRWRRLDLEAAWVNGLSLCRTRLTHSEALQATPTDWGGGWLAHVVVLASVPVSERVAITGSFVRAVEGHGHFESHHTIATGGHQFFAGVTYGR